MTTAARSPKPAPNTALLDELGRLRARVAELEAREPGAAPSGHDAARRWARHVGRLFSQTLDPDAVVNRIALGVRVVLRARMSAIFRLDAVAGDLIAIAVSGSVPPAFGGRVVLPAEAGAIGLAVRTRQPIVSANVLDDPRLVLPPQVRSALETASYRAVLAVPLIVQDQVAGVLEIGDSEGRAFTEADVELAQTLADQATVALEHARLYAEAQQRVRQTETLLNVSATVGSTLDLTEVMRRVARETCRALGADMVGAFLPDAAARFLHPIAGYHVPKEMVEAFVAYPIPLGGHPILEEAWAHQRPVWSSDVAGDPRVDRDAVHRFPHRASLFFPIVVRGVPAGAFFAAWFAERHVFGPEEIRLVEGISHQAAVALDNARLHQETEARLRQAETLLRTAHTITSALDLTEVVRRTTREIVRALGADRGGAYRFNADDTEIVPIAGYHLPKELVSAPPSIPPETVRALVAKIRESDGPIWTGGRSGAPPFEHPWVRLAPHESILVVKMRAKDEILGAIAVMWTRERHRFTDDELRLADAIARQAAVAVENARALESERALQRRQDTLVALGRELAGEIDLQRLLPRVTARSCDLMGADAALLLLLEGSALVFRGAIGVEDELRAIGRLDVNTSLTGVVVREGLPLVIPDLRESPEWRDTPVVTRFGYRAMLAVPLVYQGRTLGVLKLLHRQPRPFGSEDVAFLGALATEAGMAIENARLYDEAARGRREAEAIADLVRTINESLDLGATLERVTQAARRLCGSDVAAVALRDGDGTMALQYLAGARSGGAVGRRVEDGLGTGGQVLATGRPFRTSNCAADPRIPRAALDAADAEGITAEMVVPVTNEGRIDGLLYVSNRAPRAFTDRDETVLSRLAEHAALVITNAQLFEREQAAREASEVSEERYRNLVESLDAIVWEADAATGALTFVSGSAEALLGYPVARWLAEPGFVAEHLHPDDHEATVALGRSATLAAADYQLEYRMIAADGRAVWIHDTVRVVRDDAGRARRLRGVKVDITELKRAQQYQEIQFGVTRLLAQATSFDEALPVLFERLCRSLGWEFGEVWRVDAAADVLRRGGAWHEPSLDVGEFLEATRELAFARGVGLPGRVWQGGVPVWVSDVTTDARFARSALAATAGIHSAFAFPIRSAREMIGVLVFFSRRVYPPDEHLLKVVDDLGLQIGQFIERQQAEEALERSEQEHRSLVEGAAYGICRTSLDGRFLTVNPALVAMLGYASADELLAVNAAKDVFAREDDRAGLIEAYRATGRIREHDAQWKRADGRVITVRLTGRGLLDGAGALAGFETIVEDVTDRRQLEEQLRQAQKMEAIGRLAGGVAHDFNNLLTVIIGRSELLLQRLGPDPAPRRDVSLVQKTATRAAGLTRQLLAFSRKQLLQPKVLDLDEVVRGMGKLLRPLIGEHIELTIRSAPGIHRVNADPGQLEQVLMNLAVNARDAMSDGGRLTIETADREVETGPADAAGVRPRQPHVLLAVSDTGSGMDVATRSRIFEPFFTTKEPGKGTGLGLSTVYGIVAQSGGLVEVESEPGLGTTFKIFLPRVAAAVDTAAEEAAKLPPLRGSETILLVEDEEGVRELAREILEAHGYTVLEAAGPTEALRLAEAHEGVIHLLLTDVVMPVMRGDALAKRIARLRPATRVLYITGYVDGQLVSPAALGPDLVLLPKPFTPDALLLRVRDVLTA